MSQFINEIEARCRKFEERWPLEMEETRVGHSADLHFVESYRQIVCFQSWKVELLEKIVIDDSLLFFIEAQNDLSTSHIQARLGMWRSALKSLRSCIENVLFFLYYKDHPVELSLWSLNRHKMGFRDLLSYLDSHPFSLPAFWTEARAHLENEYATLSKAVHSGSAFRMTGAGSGITMFTLDVARLGMWSTRQKHVVRILNRILIQMFCEHLQGSSLLSLRKTCGLSIPEDLFPRIKAESGVRIVKP